MNRISKILNRHPVTSLYPLNEIEWSVRAQNALTQFNITTLDELAHADGRTLQKGKNVGATTLREFVRGCVSLGIVPRWIKDIVLALHPLASCPADMVRLAWPYMAGERWMLELAIAQLGNVPWCVVQEDLGLTLCRSVNGFKEVLPEEE